MDQDYFSLEKIFGQNSEKKCLIHNHPKIASVLYPFNKISLSSSHFPTNVHNHVVDKFVMYLFHNKVKYLI